MWPYRINIYTVLECDIGHILPFLLPRGKLEKWELVNTLKMHLFLTGSGSLAAMAVFEDKFRPDMEVCKSLQFYSFKFFSSCMLDIYKSMLDSSAAGTALLLVECSPARMLCLPGRASFWSGPAVGLRSQHCSGFCSGLWAV